MGLIVRYYLDAAPVIYLVEQVAGTGADIDARLSSPGVSFVASDLTRLECRVKPLRDGDAALLHDFDTFFAGTLAAIIPLSVEVMDLATQIRASHGFRTPDAIHLAAAIVAQCDVFLTNDHELQRFGGIAVEIVAG